jgi:hypothetical protein
VVGQPKMPLTPAGSLGLAGVLDAELLFEGALFEGDWFGDDGEFDDGEFDVGDSSSRPLTLPEQPTPTLDATSNDRAKKRWGNRNI